MMRKCFVVIIMVWMAFTSQAQTTWGTLSLIRFEFQEDLFGSVKYEPGQFSALIQELDGTTIELPGYIVPLEGKKEQAHFFFSLYPYANCFFCGNAGPETIIEVQLESGTAQAYSEEQITLQGVFRFTPLDSESVMYKLEQAKLVE